MGFQRETPLEKNGGSRAAMGSYRKHEQSRKTLSPIFKSECNNNGRSSLPKEIGLPRGGERTMGQVAKT